MAVSAPITDTTTSIAQANDEHRQRIADIEKQRSEIDDSLQADADYLAEIEAEIERNRRRVTETHSRLEAARLARAQIEVDLERTAAEIMPDRITAAVATAVAESVIQAFDDYRLVGWDDRPKNADGKRDIPSIDDRAIAFWRCIDRARDRLATTDVSDDAREMVLVTEGVILACERWELIRSGRLPADESMTGLPPSLGDCPADNRPTVALEDDLRRILRNEPPKPFESLGSIVAQRVSPDQAAKMINILLPDGSVCWGTLGQLIDTADLPCPGYLCIRFYGAYALGTAWRRRQAAVMPRREVSRLNHQARSFVSRSTFASRMPLARA